ncbi:MAG: hypothetical protein ACERKD_07415 [Prolixibacteraceae bacterium]
MNKTRYLLSMLAFVFILAACTHEKPVQNISIVPASLEIDAGVPLEFEITGEYDFLTFYSGLEGSNYDDYPDAKSKVIDIPEGESIFSTVYLDTNGIVLSKFIATTYGDWGTDLVQEVIEFEIKVNDRRTALQSFKMRADNKSISGAIDNEKGEIVCTIPAGSDISSSVTSVSTLAANAQVFLDGKLYVDRSKLDYTKDTKVFTIMAVDGVTKQNFTVIIIEE